MLKTIYKYAENYDINITFRRKGDKLVMILVPKLLAKDKDLAKEVEKLPPLTITETPDILQDNFEELVGAALNKVSSIQSVIDDFDKAADKLSKKVEEKTGKKVESAKPKAEEKKENGLFDKEKQASAPVPAEPVPAEKKQDDKPKSPESANLETGDDITEAEDDDNTKESVEESDSETSVAETESSKMDDDNDW